MDVRHIARLANLTLTDAESRKFTSQFSDTLSTIDVINELDTSDTPITYQVTGLTNCFREDKIDTGRILTQQAALSNSASIHNGYFMVSAIFE
ncbi:MAG: Aspartyl/glutamyl-tRNA(Asn/Gln) amidotransferase subunit C [Candidatus Amesbacteria bacterium GW2011_GWB1_47_19]|nr:MAG: Aspartyl/glutamyl-tRNA(Asn/Gln) amidotransferase subunit C [Candidatus Amesbacteria bacterium GW2011_GWA1_44_24]KKU30872.1 MAG: Aspartyl/glutamyl-tRNA(Asn/Gln) amidotransferase subunit C [Candidatus Amesbacteria bacterium GW2011_GWC1_46_24]KKU66561.1 MAG: Aspartyl/glutamyl-tRNA(Asn/Gln) amidotransferase subunit C [Candidatus Amesbacteria bacterium GW2011_GWB1_47_19]OGD05861.1 MAG: hypothetical protein A2379_02005 [Candidatus Amesbacteria bacterium RIFOXYB1_FULL_47_13]HBC73075.1 Asp-tRNA